MIGRERLAARFAALAKDRRAAFVPFITAGDPDAEVSLALLKALAENGGDIIELGVPFSDPMADGPAVQASSLRALKAGATLRKTLDMVRAFRKGDWATPLVLMGYLNPVMTYGYGAFAADAAEAGVDGLIVVDLPPEEEGEFKPIAEAAGLSLIRFVAPTTDDTRLERTGRNVSGYVYLISIAGVTGTKTIDVEAIRPHVDRTRKATGLPVAVGFGIKTPGDAKSVAEIADGVVVGSAIVDRVKLNLSVNGQPGPNLVADVAAFARSLADAVRSVSKHEG